MLRNVLYKYAKFGTVNFDERARIWELFREGIGVVNVRKTIRAEGIKLSNQTISNVVKEERLIQKFASAVNRTKSTRTIAKRLVIDTPQLFGTNYMYRATAVIRSSIDHEEQRVELNFGDDRLLPANMIRAKFRDMGKRIAEKGGVPRQDGSYMTDARLVRIELDSVIRGGQNVA